MHVLQKDETALMIASKEGHKDIVSYLLAKKASVSHTDVEGATVLFVTASVGNYEVLKLLLSNPRAIAEINTKNRVSRAIIAGFHALCVKCCSPAIIIW